MGANIGYKTTIKSLKTGSSQFIVFSRKNCSRLCQYEIKYLASLSRLEDDDVYRFDGSNLELGRKCGKRTRGGQYLRVSSLSVTDPGDSDFIETMRARVKRDKSGL